MKEAGKMGRNSTLEEIGRRLASADSILIFPHILMDGDSLGSAIALARTLRGSGKPAHIILEDKIPAYLKFLDDGSCTYNMDIIKGPDVCIAVDCSDTGRFVRRKEKFFGGKTTICIDHHKTSEPFADMNYSDGAAAATGVIIYDLLSVMGTAPDKRAGEAIFAAITTDTGNFQYSNTDARSHIIAANLYDLGIDHAYVSMMLYQNTRIEKFRISGKILDTMKLMACGEAVMAYVTREMLSESGALMEDTEGVSEMLRNISGIELSIFAKESGQNETKFSMRSKKWVDASELALKYKGGGHARAAGCTVAEQIFDAIKMMETDVEEYFARRGEGK